MKYIKLFEDYHDDNNTSSSHRNINHSKPDATHQHHVVRGGTHEDRDIRDIIPNIVTHHFKTREEAKNFHIRDLMKNQDTPEENYKGKYLDHKEYMKNGNLHPVDSETGHVTH